MELIAKLNSKHIVFCQARCQATIPGKYSHNSRGTWVTLLGPTLSLSSPFHFQTVRFASNYCTAKLKMARQWAFSAFSSLLLGRGPNLRRGRLL